jgi:hypothetical protein
MPVCLGGGTGRRTGLKSLRVHLSSNSFQTDFNPTVIQECDTEVPRAGLYRRKRRLSVALFNLRLKPLAKHGSRLSKPSFPRLCVPQNHLDGLEPGNIHDHVDRNSGIQHVRHGGPTEIMQDLPGETGVISGPLPGSAPRLHRSAVTVEDIGNDSAGFTLECLRFFEASGQHRFDIWEFGKREANSLLVLRLLAVEDPGSEIHLSPTDSGQRALSPSRVIGQRNQVARERIRFIQKCLELFRADQALSLVIFGQFLDVWADKNLPATNGKV